MTEALRTAVIADLLSLGDNVKAEILGSIVQIQALPRYVRKEASPAKEQVQ